MAGAALSRRPPPANALEAPRTPLARPHRTRLLSPALRPPRQVADLKRRIASLLRVDPAAIRLRRGGPRGAHLRAEAHTAVGAGGAGLTDGAMVHVEAGPSLGATEQLVSLHWCAGAASPLDLPRGPTLGACG